MIALLGPNWLTFPVSFPLGDILMPQKECQFIYLSVHTIYMLTIYKHIKVKKKVVICFIRNQFLPLGGNIAVENVQCTAKW